MELGTSGIWLGAMLAGYCFGCVDMAWLLAFWRHDEIHAMGNGNPGASNALMTMGVKAGVFTAIWDIGKAGMAYAFTYWALQGPRDACLLASGMAVIGHCYPFWLDFRGGKGFAPFIGFMLCGDPGAAALPLFLGAVIGIATDRIVALTFTCAALWPLLLYTSMGWPYAAFYLPLSLVLLWRHRSNIRNLIAGTEPGIRAAFRKGGRAA